MKRLDKPEEPGTLPEEANTRIIHVNDRTLNQTSKFVSNYVSTAKYSVYSFLFKFLYEQFSKYANVFFLITAAIQVLLNLLV
jgi:phospholipid-transporting ATPase